MLCCIVFCTRAILVKRPIWRHMIVVWVHVITKSILWKYQGIRPRFRYQSQDQVDDRVHRYGCSTHVRLGSSVPANFSDIFPNRPSITSKFAMIDTRAIVVTRLLDIKIAITTIMNVNRMKKLYIIF